MSNCGCGEQLDVATLQAQQRRVLTWVLVINASTFIMMLTGTLLSGSSSLLSGTLDNLGDALTYGLSLVVVGASSTAKARVAFFKGILILGAAVAVAAKIVWHAINPEVPIVETMGVVALLNLAANLLCLRLLYAHRNADVNMSSVWECSRNDIADGLAVILATALVWVFSSGWPDILIAIALLVLFLRSATRVLRNAWRELHPVHSIS
jgi:Co/Zn/Cd efflux system component